MQKELDEIDLTILNILQDNAKTPLREIANEIHLSSPATAGRIKKLEENGYILKYRTEINPKAFGLNIKAFISVEVGPMQKKRFYPYIKRCKNVVQCNCVTGDYSMLIEVLFETTQDLDYFIGELQKFGRTKTMISFSTAVEHRGILL